MASKKLAAGMELEQYRKSEAKDIIRSHAPDSRSRRDGGEDSDEVDGAAVSSGLANWDGDGMAEMRHVMSGGGTPHFSPSSQSSAFEVIDDAEVQMAPALARLKKYTDDDLASSFTVLSTDEEEEVQLPNPAALKELETSVRAISDNVSHMLGNMSASLHAVCGKTRVCTEAYGAAVEDIGHNVDETLQMMYQLIQHCEAISHNMQFISAMADQLKSIKATLAVFEKMVK